MFFIQNLGTILIGAILIVIITLIVLKLRRDKKKGGCVSCDGCTRGSCPYSSEFDK